MVGDSDSGKYRCFECEGQIRKMHVGKVCLDCGLVYLPESVQVARQVDTGSSQEAEPDG